MLQRYLWKIEATNRHTPDTLAECLYGPCKRVQALNKWVDAIEILIYQDHVLLAMALVGHDQWWINRRTPKIIAAILTQARLSIKLAEHIGFETPPNLKSARYMTANGKRVFSPEPDSPRVTKPGRRGPCIACKEPVHWLDRNGYRRYPSILRGEAGDGSDVYNPGY